MVRYTGRQKTITGSVNRNQVGLKMSGCPSRVGRSGKNLRLLGRRVNCMYGLCGPTMVNGAPWRTTGRNDPPYCRQRSTSCAQAAGGVGHINSPYTRTRVPAAGKQGCTQVGSTALDPAAALRLLRSYFHQIFGGTGSVILVGKIETLVGDGITANFDEIKHYYSGTSEYSALPAHIKKSVDVINNLKIMGSLAPGEPAVPHVVGWETWGGQTALHNAHYGQQVSVGLESVTMFGTCSGPCADTKDALRWQFYNTIHNKILSHTDPGPWFYFTMKYVGGAAGGCTSDASFGKISNCPTDIDTYNNYISTHITTINANSGDPTYVDSMFTIFIQSADSDLNSMGYNFLQTETAPNSVTWWFGGTDIKYSPISQDFMDYLVMSWGNNYYNGIKWTSPAWSTSDGTTNYLDSSGVSICDTWGNCQKIPASTKYNQMGWRPCVSCKYVSCYGSKCWPADHVFS